MNEYDVRGVIHDREHYEGWERYLRAERRDLQARREGMLRRLLGMALPEERPEELERLAREDQRRAERGLVELQGDGQTWYKSLEELTPDDLPARAEAEMTRARWLRRRQERMKKMIRGD